MSEKKIQKIAVLITFSQSDKSLILNGIKIASIFKKELCLVYRYSKREKHKRNYLKQKMQEYLVPVKYEIAELVTSSLLVSGKISELPEMLADDFEIILIVSDSAHFRRYSKAAAESPVPFLFINADADVSQFSKIILPLDMRKESSDSALWSSWFGRFNFSKVIVLAASDKGKDAQKQVAKNVILTKKLMKKSGIIHKIYKGQKSSLGNAFEALELAQSSKSDLLIVLGSSIFTPIDWLVGLPERKIIKKAGEIPVLLVNPRRDNYILCD